MSKTWKRKTNTKYKHITTSPNNSICYKIKKIAREMKKRKEKKRNSFQNFLIKWSSKTRENSLIEFKDFLYLFLQENDYMYIYIYI